jgi:hypothetical protein
MTTIASTCGAPAAGTTSDGGREMRRGWLQGSHAALVAFRRKNIPFLDDKPEPSDEKEAAFRRFFADLGARDD